MTTSDALLRSLFRHRRLARSESSDCELEPCDTCIALHRSKVDAFVAQRAPIHFVLPAFPAKSPSPTKVLGRLPDRAEEIALRYLSRVCDELRAIYTPGARITICSDGRVFADLVGVSDDDVTRYSNAINSLIARVADPHRSAPLDTFRLEEAPEMREWLCERYAEPLSTIRARVRSSSDDRRLFDGIHRFLFEDRIALEPHKTRSRVRRECKLLAYAVIQRSNAWSRLVETRFPDALRLSIHPQPPHSSKIGIRLTTTTGGSDDAWLTPWHGVAVERAGHFSLMRRRDAEALAGACIVHDGEGRPSHYEVRA